MAIRTSSAVWEGSIKEGKGRMRLGSGAYEGAYSWHSRFADEKGSNPEELIGAAHAGCFSMALSDLLTGAHHIPDKIETEAKVHLKPGSGITLIELITKAIVPGIDEKSFLELAEKAKKGCPVSQALAAVEITLDAKLV
jgi:osmotically inducible protein OsmC